MSETPVTKKLKRVIAKYETGDISQYELAKEVIQIVFELL